VAGVCRHATFSNLAHRFGRKHGFVKCRQIQGVWQPVEDILALIAKGDV